jgi:uncharacterized protein
LKQEKQKDITKIYPGWIEKLKPLLDELTDKEVWISEKLKREILKKVGEE